MGKEFFISHSVGFRPEQLAWYLIEYTKNKHHLDSLDFLVTEDHPAHTEKEIPVGHLARLHEKSCDYAAYLSYIDKGEPRKSVLKAFKLIEMLKEVR